MRKAFWAVLAIITILIVAALHYSLPQHDVVRIVGTEVKRMDIDGSAFFWAEADSMSTPQATRDVRFVNAVSPSGSPRVYRNEDTNWSYPPYLKFNSGSLTAQAQALSSGESDPIWVSVSHYGWRIEMFTMFPNVIDIDPVDGPDDAPLPWFNMFFFASVIGIVLVIRRLLIRFRERHIDPLQEEVEQTFEDVSDTTRAAVTGWSARVRQWIDRVRARPERRR